MNKQIYWLFCFVLVDNTIDCLVNNIDVELQYELKLEHKLNTVPRLEPNAELISESKIEPKVKPQPKSELHINGDVQFDKPDIKPIIRNGIIRLSNLDSTGICETMILDITFSSSDSEDSASEYDTLDNHVS